MAKLTFKLVFNLFMIKHHYYIFLCLLNLQMLLIISVCIQVWDKE